jgi:integrase
MGVRLLPSGRHQARFTYRGREYAEVWDTEKQAAAWIQRTRRELVAGTYVDQVVQNPETGKPLAPTFAEYAAKWVAERNLRPRTRAEYVKMLPGFKALNNHRVDVITREQVKAWYSRFRAPAVAKKHHYELLRAIFNGVVDDEWRETSPVRIKGAAKVIKRPAGDLPTPLQIHELADAMPTPKYRTMVLISAWCGLRFGETTELRAKDIVLGDDGLPLVVKVRRAVTRVDGTYVTGPPKSDAGVRDVVIPPHIRRDLAAYLGSLPAGPDVLLFPATQNPKAHMSPSALYKPYYLARAKVGLPGLRWHDLRHFSATEAARAGATVAEIMARYGHSTYAASMRYQHAASGRDEVIAERLSASVIQLDSRRTA